MSVELNPPSPAATEPVIRVGPPPQAEKKRRTGGIPGWALKVAAAVTGFIWAVFLVIHFYGNLKVFQGADAFNNYAHWLKNAFYPFFPETGVLWLMRAVLVPALIIHVTVVAMIWWRGRQSRGKFRAHISGVASWASWLMPLTGILTLVFIIFHVLDLTVGATPAATSSFMAATSESSFAYENLIASFQRPASGIFYMLIMVLLGVHILKGFSNMAADLGAMGKRIRAAFIAVGGIAATLILFGNAAIPAAVLLGVLP